MMHWGNKFDLTRSCKSYSSSGLALLRPIYMVRLCRMHQVYDRPANRAYSSLTTVVYVKKIVVGFVTEIYRTYVFCDKFLLSRGRRRSFFRQNGGRSCC